MTADQVSAFGIVYTALAFLAFSAAYGVLAPWWRSALGRNVMALMASCGLFVSLGVIKLVWPHTFDHMPWLRPAVWLVIGTIGWWRVVLLIHEQRRRGKVTLTRKAGQARTDPQEGP